MSRKKSRFAPPTWADVDISSLDELLEGNPKSLHEIQSRLAKLRKQIGSTMMHVWEQGFDNFRRLSRKKKIRAPEFRTAIRVLTEAAPKVVALSGEEADKKLVAQQIKGMKVVIGDLHKKRRITDKEYSIAIRNVSRVKI